VRTITDPDLWGHLRFGLDVLATWSLPSQDPYSFTQDVPWVNHEWLSEATMAIAYLLAETVGLVLLKTGLVAAALMIVWRAHAPTALPIRIGVILLCIWGSASILPTLRPQLWTLVGIAVLCSMFVAGLRRWWLAAIPALFVIWVNAHGGWIVGAGLLAVWTAGQILYPQRTRAFAVAVALLGAAGTLVNPYGIQMWGFLATTVSFSRDISEWQPLFAFSITDWLPWVVTMIVAGAAAFSRIRPPLDHLIMIAMLAYASFRVIRIAPLCVTAALLLLQPTISAWAQSARPAFKPLTRTAAGSVLVALIGLALGSSYFVARAATCIPFTGEWNPDRAAGRALARAGLHGRLVTWFGWGQYALWHLSPDLRVSMDGRRETIYSAERLEAHAALYRATPEGLAFFRQLNPEYVWLPTTTHQLRAWLVQNGYRIDVSTAHSYIATRHDRPPVVQKIAAESGCFPGP
jgi:hypothetical protein